jgi:phosphorylase kinase gamma subunit
VRRCIEKETGREFAAKIIDLSEDNDTHHAVRESTISEVQILRLVAGHPYISKIYTTH